MHLNLEILINVTPILFKKNKTKSLINNRLL